MWFGYEGSAGVGTGLIALTPERVKEIIQLNQAGKKPADLKAFEEEIVRKEPDYDNVVGQDSLNRFDNKFSNKKRKKKKPAGPRPEGTVVAEAKPANAPHRPQAPRPNNTDRPAGENTPAEGNKPAQGNHKRNNQRRRPPRPKTGGNENSGV
jgi:hypothetical protein